MKSSKRQAATAAGILALSLVGTSAHAQANAQRGGPPAQDTPYILITTFQSADRQLGPDMADELRKRIQGEHAAKELYVIPKTSINATLEASGYKADSALNSSDLMELSKQLRGEYVIDGKVAKTGNGVHLESRLLTRTANQTFAQPLPPIDGKDAGDVAKNAEREISNVLKGMASYKACTNDLRASKYAEAEKDARAGIAAYPNSTFNRLCLLSAFTYNKAAPDSIVSLSNAILAIDPTSLLALGNLAEAYKAKGDKDKVIETNLRIYRADPTNQSVVQSIIADLANSGAPDKAIPIVDSLLKDNPADPAMIGTKWKLQLAAKQYKAAIATGEQLVKLDTTQATLDYFNRQIGAAQSDSDATTVQRLAARAAQKFPSEVTFPLILAQSYAKTGQMQQSLDAARRAAEIDPKNMNAYQFALSAAAGMKQSDTVTAIAKRALTAGVDKNVIGVYLLGPATDAYKKATESKSRADWQAAFDAAKSVDDAAPTPQSKFYVGITSFQLAADYVTEIQTLAKSTKKADKEQACTNAKTAEDLFATTSIAMPAGGSVDKAVAGQILGGVGQYSEYIAQVKKAFCK